MSQYANAYAIADASADDGRASALRELRRLRGHDLAGCADLDALAVELREALQRVQRAAVASDAHCVICWDAPKAVVFLPCKHRCCCEQCARQSLRCPLCKAAVTERMRVFG